MSLTILTADELQNLEMRAANQLGADTLMKRAGAAAAELIMKRLEDAGVEQRRVTLLVGPGNNGGDALACACELREKGAVVNVVLPGGRRPTSALALAQLERWTQAGGTTYDDPYMTEKADCVVDGLFGTGLAKPITGDSSTPSSGSTNARPSRSRSTFRPVSTPSRVTGPAAIPAAAPT